jgi:transketolase
VDRDSLQSQAHAIRFLAVDAILRAGEGHQGVPLGMAEIASALYTKHLRIDASAPDWWDRDRFVLSNGHGSMLLYALLHLTGHSRIDRSQLETFRVLGSHCAGHPERDIASGIEVTTGPLGQGIANALGMAIAEASLNARFGDSLVNHRTWAFVGDGCLQEGVGQETIALAGHLKLGKLTFFWDDNRITDDGATNLSISEDVAERFRVGGWHVQEVDGHDLEAVDAAIRNACDDPRPSMIACRTTIARGIARLEGQRGGHSAKLYDTDRQAMSERYDWPHAPFDVPAPVLDAWRGAGQRSASDHEAWRARVAALPATQRAEFERTMRGELPKTVDEALLDFKRRAIEDKLEGGGINLLLGGINISAEINERLRPLLPERIVACADLEAPTDHKRGSKAFSASDRSGTYVHCGVREHAMGSLANGLAAHGGVVPLAVTYLPFSDYLRPSMRMAALMGLPVKFVFSHDSIGIGRNGPTHQPVEILASLRAMPNMLVLRPADAVEVAECWAIALEQRATPVSLVFARQTLPRVRSSHTNQNLSRRGAYVLADAVGGARRVTLLATGSEVLLAMQAREQLQAQGVATAVVSMPSWELFEQQDSAYQDSVLGPGTVRVAVEAAARFGWDRWLGSRGAFIGMKGFGASAAAEVLYEHFGITAQVVVSNAQRLLNASN